MISIILPVHNKQDLIEQVLRSICDNSSPLVKEVLVILDGCTDLSEYLVYKFTQAECLCNPKINWRVFQTPDVWEVKACNYGLRLANEQYCASVQDDMVITEHHWDARLIKPFLTWNNVFAVSSLAAHDLTINKEGHIDFPDIKNAHNTARNIFAIRDSVNRGPLMMRHSMLGHLNYLDEVFAPLGMDDMDICLRAYQHGWISGLYPMPHFSKPEWGTTRNNGYSAGVASKAWVKNDKILVNRHRAALIGPKHAEDRLLEE